MFAQVYRKRQVPFRVQEIAPSSLATTDDEQLDSITRHHIINELRRTTGATSKNNGIDSTVGTLAIVVHWLVIYSNRYILYLTDDSDLVVTMASRLGQVECELLSTRKEIIEKDHHIR